MHLGLCKCSARSQAVCFSEECKQHGDRAEDAEFQVVSASKDVRFHCTLGYRCSVRQTMSYISDRFTCNCFVNQTMSYVSDCFTCSCCVTTISTISHCRHLDR